MDTEDYLKFDEEIHKVARFLCREHPDMEFDDMKQSLWEILLKYQSHGKYTELDDKNLRNRLRYDGMAVCTKNRQEHLIISPQYGYRTKDVRALFETFWFYENWVDAKVPDDALGIDGEQAHVRSDEGMTMTSDMSVAFGQLSDKYKEIIYREFRDNEDLNKDERKVLDNALHRMTEILNTYRGPRG